MQNISFNIWDDYEVKQNTHGYVEEYDFLDYFQRVAIAELVCLQCQKLSEINATIDEEYVQFVSLSHVRRERLIEELNALNLIFNGLKIDFYSES